MIGNRRPRWSLAAQLALLVVVFVAVPVILYKEFEAADRAKAGLLLQTVQDQGRIIATAAAPYLALKPKPGMALDDMLAQLAGPRISAKILFRPAGRKDAGGFFYIAASPKADSASLESQRDQLARQGVLDNLAAACTLDMPAALRYRAPGGKEELITSVTPVLNAAGCWAIVTSYSDQGLLDSSLGQDYWQTGEIRVAAAIYLAMALLVLSIFLRLWRGLRGFSALAGEISRGGAAGSFSARNRIPELDGVAVAFDRMVESLRELSRAVEQSPSPVVMTDAQGRIEYVNPAFCALTGYAPEDLVAEDCRLLRSPETPAETYADLWRTISRGEVWRGELRNRKRDGEVYWALVSISSLKDADGRITSYIGLQEDITERKRAERQRALLLAELNHRVKNTLATVKSIAVQMLRQTGSIDAFRTSFEGRLRALAQAHDLLTRTNWEGADLETTVTRTLKPFDRSEPSAIEIDGATLTLPPRAALVLTMMFHELATNAAKYGALSVAGGKVAVSWRVEDEGDRQRLRLDWRERGGPKVSPPAQRGFGANLIERGVVYELDGSVDLRYPEDGVECAIQLPWPIEAEGEAEPDESGRLAAAA